MHAVSFPRINQLSEIELRSNVPSATSIKVMALDFDHTLGISKYLCASDFFDVFMWYRNEDRGHHNNAHAPLLLRLREITRFRACEEAPRATQFLEKCKEDEWDEVILTARPEDMREVTRKNIAEAGLPHHLNDKIIFSRDKATSLSKWLRSHPKWSQATHIEVAFADDKISSCRNMLRLHELLQGATKAVVRIRCYHYVRAEVPGHLTEPQRKVIAAQLAAFKSGLPIPADDELNPEHLPDLPSDEVYNAAAHISQKMGHPFDSCDNRCKRVVQRASAVASRLKVAAVAALLLLGGVYWQSRA